MLLSFWSICESTHSKPKIRNNVVNYVLSFRPVCPSGDGGVWESSSSSSHLDPLPSFIWPSTSSVSLEGKWITTNACFKHHQCALTSVTPVDALVWCCNLTLLSLQGFCSAAFIWKDKLREAPGKVRTLLPAIYTAGHTEGVQTLAYLSSFWFGFNLLCLP